MNEIKNGVCSTAAVIAAGSVFLAFYPDLDNVCGSADTGINGNGI